MRNRISPDRKTRRVHRPLIGGVLILACLSAITTAVISAAPPSGGSDGEPPAETDEDRRRKWRDAAPDSTVDPADSGESVQQMARRQWRVFLDKIPLGVFQADVQKHMAGKFRDMGTIYLGGSGATTVVYLIDDHHEVRFSFDMIKGLQRKDIRDRSMWTRFPNGQLTTEAR